MEGSWFKDLRNEALLYFAGGILSSALGLLAWVILYKLHIYFGFSQPNTDGAVAIAFGGMIIFKYLTEIKLELLGPVSYTHLTLPTMSLVCRSRWSPYH